MGGAVVFKAGDFRHKIDIQQRSNARDANYGAIEDAWSTLKSGLWALIESAGAAKLFKDETWVSEVTHQITVRYDPIFDDTRTAAAYRISYNSRLFNILGVYNIDERNKLVIIAAKEGLNPG